MTASPPMPAHRAFALVIILAMALGAIVPFIAPPPIRAISITLTVSQVYGGGGNDGAPYTHDFIELYNLTDAPIDLSGLSLQYASATGTGNFGTSTQLTELGGTIPAGGHFLVQEVQGAGGTSALPTPDLVDPTPIAMSATAGKVALVTGTTSLGCNGGSTLCTGEQLARIVDLVGWGSANFFEGGPAPTTSNSTAVIRDDAGATDTDNNAADFTAGTPNPRNSGTLSGVGNADPSSVEPGDTTLLTVEVTPASDSTDVEVTADLTGIVGLEMQPFFNDGTNGDVTAGDLVLSFSVTVGAATEPGTKELPVNISDAQGNVASTSISLTVEDGPIQIWEIQGAAHISPLNGDQVFGVDGIVTAVSLLGFWMTDLEPDGDDATSDGIFVFRGATGTKPAIGDQVSVDGTVSEFRPGGATGNGLTITQIGSATFSVLASELDLTVTLIGEGGRIPPTEVIDNDANGSVEDAASGTVFDPEQDGIDFWESLEGMYLQVDDALAVGPRNGFGEIAIVADGGVNAGPYTERGGLHINDGEFNPERLILDDVIAPTPFVNTGDSFTTAVTGVLDYGFGNFKLYPTTALVGVSRGIQREATDAPGAHDLAVGSFNVENLSVGNPQEKFDTLAGQVVHNMRSPDLLAIQEVQDDSGSSNNGVVTGEATWQRLIEAIVAQGGPLYEFRSIDPVNNADGGAPGANIRVGFLFRTDRGLEFVDRPGGTSLNDTSVADHPSGPRLTFSPGRIGTDDEAFLSTRKSLAGEFRWRGERLFVVANHFSSKLADDPLFGRFQPPVRYTEFYFPGTAVADTDGWRWGQAQAVNDFVDDVLALDENANVIVLGDINDFQFSDTVSILEGTARDIRERTVQPDDAPVLTTLFDRLVADEQYSYVFDGNSQVLDQILVSDNVWDRDPAYDVIHVNAEFAVQASDHEPSVMRVAFQPSRGK